MKQSLRFVNDMLDFDAPDASQDVLWRACKPTAVMNDGRTIVIDVPFQAQKRIDGLAPIVPDPDIAPKIQKVFVRLYGNSTIRFSLNPDGIIPGDECVMFEWDNSMDQRQLFSRQTELGWDILDSDGMTRMRIRTKDYERQAWGSQPIQQIPETWEAVVIPDGKTEIEFMAYDQFFPGAYDSISLAYIERNGVPHRSLFSLYAAPNEKFAGTGERFARMNLAGQTLYLENMDAMGVNNRKAYKNVPFYISDEPYGLFIHTSAHIRLSLAHFSTRAAQGLVEDPMLDLFFIGGDSIEQIIRNYRCITGFPRRPPLWSYGVWMSRMTYLTADETYEVANRLREQRFPCDVIHLDTGWFETDWQCDWEFSKTRFPDPAKYMQNMRQKGFRISVWQMPTLSKENRLFELAKENGYIAPKKVITTASGSNFGGLDYAGTLDFSNSETVEWYKGLLRKLLQLGVAAIKTDFGEEIDMEAEYKNLPARLLHNLYALLYQKAAFEVTEEVKGQGLIWARAGWAGCQRYPVHWAGDSASTWDGMAGTLRGGLHFGLSGFGFWSHDVPGFHGIPGFTDTKPSNDIYVRWTQFGVFTSHMRYHGGFPREPYEYPEVADIVRGWLQFRYSLIPYFIDQADVAITSGYLILRSMIFDHSDDPLSWVIDDQFYCGANLLVAPIMNSEGTRDVYLPDGKWVDIWTGEIIEGPMLLKGETYPLSRLPIYAVYGSKIRIYPEIVQCTDEMDLDRSVYIIFNDDYRGIENSALAEVVADL